MVAQLMGSLFQGSFTTPALPAFSLGGVAASVAEGQSRHGFAQPTLATTDAACTPHRCQVQG